MSKWTYFDVVSSIQGLFHKIQALHLKNSRSFQGQNQFFKEFSRPVRIMNKEITKILCHCLLFGFRFTFISLAQQLWYLYCKSKAGACILIKLVLSLLSPEITSDAVVECMERFTASSNTRLSNLAKIFLQVDAAVVNSLVFRNSVFAGKSDPLLQYFFSEKISCSPSISR